MLKKIRFWLYSIFTTKSSRRRKSKDANKRSTKKVKVARYSLGGNLETVYDSISAASKDLDCNSDAISHAINGISKRSNNYMWRRADKNDSFPKQIKAYNYKQNHRHGKNK